MKSDNVHKYTIGQQWPSISLFIIILDKVIYEISTSKGNRIKFYQYLPKFSTLVNECMLCYPGLLVPQPITSNIIRQHLPAVCKPLVCNLRVRSWSVVHTGRTTGQPVMCHVGRSGCGRRRCNASPKVSEFDR